MSQTDDNPPVLTFGDFSTVAGLYSERPGYALPVVLALAHLVDYRRDGFRAVDIGAGTGNLTKMLLNLGISGYAVEPQEAMRLEGQRQTGSDDRIIWIEGTADDPGLPDGSVDWIVASSAFDWSTPEIALPRYHKILRPGGRFTAIWDYRDLRRDKHERYVEDLIHELVPGLTRAYVRVQKMMAELETTLVSTGHFKDVLYMEATHQEPMSHDRYMRIWNSVHDIPSQASLKTWNKVLTAIHDATVDSGDRSVIYLSQAWTVERA